MKYTQYYLLVERLQYGIDREIGVIEATSILIALELTHESLPDEDKDSQLLRRREYIVIPLNDLVVRNGKYNAVITGYVGRLLYRDTSSQPSMIEIPAGELQ